MKTPLTVRKPKGQIKGGVVVIQEAFGVTDHIVNVCQRIADAGYVAVAPHLFHRTGDPKLGYEDFSQIYPHIEALSLDTLFSDVDAALEELKSQGLSSKQIGVVGFCIGGTITVFAAQRYQLGAAVTYYGGGIHGRWFFPSQIDVAESLQTPWLGFYGDADLGIPFAEVEELREAMQKAKVPTEIVRYADAGHGFNCDDRADFNEQAARDAWGRMLSWFDSYIAKV